ncbi:MAG: hypothetical protein ACOY3L_01045 [Pseudomonadota bacterium]
MAGGFDFLAAAGAGARLQTRDRREVRNLRVAPEQGLIHGEVPMHGPCCWRADGRFEDAPFGAAGPLDLMPPALAEAANGSGLQQRASLKDALAEGEGRPFCCD